MPVNVLTSEVGIKIGPIVLETLVKHYFERTLKNTNLNGTGSTQLRKDELLYDEAFNIVKVRSPISSTVRNLTTSSLLRHS